ncbi:MAG TPA: hypothetical protein VFH73_12805 [Polyangia bacterium]|nr:hypothetical protein [Polyangia bacterium]
MNRKLATAVLLVLGSAVGCATSPSVHVARGRVLSTSAGARAIVTGPTTVHAYAAFAGGEVYSTRVTTGTDADCAHTRQGGAAVRLPADKVISVTVAAGETACLRTEARGGYELLWHALAQQPTPHMVADATYPRAR